MSIATAHRLSREQVIWSFGPDLEPVLEVDPGETVTFETNDCFTGQIGDAGVAQACKPAPGSGAIARFSIPRIDACPRPFSEAPSR